MKNKSLILSAIALSATHLTATLSAQAEHFTLLIHETASEFSSRINPLKAPKYWEAYTAVAKEMVDAGIMRGGTALQSGSAARQLGPLTLTRQPAELGGYFIIEVADIDAALKWAYKIPASKTGRVIIIPHMGNPTMTPDNKK